MNSQKTFLRNISEGLVYSAAFSIALKGVWFFVSLAIIAKLSLHQYGTYQIVIAAWGLLGTFLLASADQVLIARGATLIKGDGSAARALAHSATAVRLQIVAVLLVAVYLATPILDRWYSGDVLAFLKIMALMLVVLPLDGIIRFEFAVQKRFFLMNLFTFVEEAIKAVGIILSLFVFSGGVAGLLWAAVVAMYVKNIIFIGFAFPYARNLRSVSLRPFIEILWTVGKWNIARQYMGQLTTNGRIFFIQYFVGREGVALFSMSFKLFTHLSSLFPMVSFLIPLISSEIDDRYRLRHLLERAIKYTVPIFAVLGVIAAAAAPSVIHSFFPEYAPSLPLFYVLLIAIPLIGFSEVLASFFFSQQEQRMYFFVALARTVITCAALPLLLMGFGITGAAIETTAGFVIFVLVRYRILTHLYPDLRMRATSIFSVDEYDRTLAQKISQASRKLLTRSS